MREQPAGDASQSALRIAQVAADQKTENDAGDPIADPAASRNLALEAARSQHQAVGFAVESVSHAQNVLGMMLAVGIRGHHAAAWIFGKNMRDPGPQRGALSQVPRVIQNRGPAGRKYGIMARAAAVIDHHDSPKGTIFQGFK
jgi:hypothetical protein